MFKVLLAWRYLRSRYIALASIISVTLGVATMIVVNSVMAGFSKEMHARLHGILSDIVIESPRLEGIEDPQWYFQQIRQELGDDVVGMTAAVHVPAMISFRFRGRWMNHQIQLIGIDAESYSQVSDFSKHLLHPENRQKLDFLLRNTGYAPDRESLRYSGWQYRRFRYAPLAGSGRPAATQQPRSASTANQQPSDSPAVAGSAGAGKGDEPVMLELRPPSPLPVGQSVDLDAVGGSDLVAAGSIPRDPFVEQQVELEGSTFDPTIHQHTGVILGIAIASRRVRQPDGPEDEMEEVFLLRPGDDIQITFPNAGAPPRPQNNSFTVVDLYESKMSEYDSSFAFVPLKSLQHFRGMGKAVTSIQLKLRPGVDLAQTRKKLEARFPVRDHQFHIRTWRDMRAPLLSAVQMETTILNVLLFLIIAVAGFGILATFFMIVRDKTRDIGILKSLGARSRGVMSIFLSYGLSLGIVGSGVGMILGLVLVWNINKIANGLSWLTGREIFDETVYYFKEIPTSIEPWTVTWVVLGAIAIAVMASILPARKAAKLHPVEALRYE